MRYAMWLVPCFWVFPVLMSSARAALPPGYVCHRAPAAPVLDGDIEEACWRDAAWTADFGDIEGSAKPRPALRTRAKMLWDDRYLYVAAELEEPDLCAGIRDHDAVIFKDNDFEVFVDAAGDGRSYAELELNALNTTWDLFLTRPYREGGLALHDWEMKGLKTAVKLHGSLNHPGDRDRGWTVELAIPWSALRSVNDRPGAGVAPKAGEEMRINFSRVQWRMKPDVSSPTGYAKIRDAAGAELPEMNWTWAPQEAVDMHRPEYWGVLRFTDATPERRTGYLPDPDEAVRAELFRLYREQAAHRAATGRYASDWSGWLPPERRLRGVPVASVFRGETVAGLRYVVQAESPYTGDRWRITDDGVVSRERAPEAVRRARLFKVWMWVHGGDAGLTPARFREFRDAGVDAVLIDGGPEVLAKLAPQAAAAGLEAHAWMWALNRPGDAQAAAHPDWFAVSREGKSCHDRPPYVDYYRFLCPNQPAVREYLRGKLAEHAAVPGVVGVQLDYIRLPDVILPRALWEKYGLVMDRELPPYDFCYCARCAEDFRREAGRPVASDPTTDLPWRRFREESVTRVVRELRAEADRRGVLLEAAVFPYPSLARGLVRQSWGEWPLDAVLPMTYNSFYREPDAWITDAVAKGRSESGGRFPVQAGLHLPDVPPERLGEFLALARRGGAEGVALFSHEHLDARYRAALADALRRLREQARP